MANHGTWKWRVHPGTNREEQFRQGFRFRFRCIYLVILQTQETSAKTKFGRCRRGHLEGTTAIFDKYRELLKRMKQARVGHIVLSGIVSLFGGRSQEQALQACNCKEDGN